MSLQPRIRRASALPGPVRRWPPGQAVAVLFCSLMAAFAQIPGWSDLLFPELAALSSTLLRDPTGPWARSTWQLVLLPTLCAAAGVWISRHCPDPAAALLLAVLAAKLLLLLARSPLVPALSAAALPVILGLHSWAYPQQVGMGLLALALVLLAWRHWRRLPPAAAVPVPPEPGLAGLRQPGLLRWFGLLALLLLIERSTGLRDAVVPPLIVIAHDGLLAPARCPWIHRPWLLPIACGATALLGVLIAQRLPSPPLATALILLLVLQLQQLLRLRLAPLLALGLLPLVLPAPDLRLVPAVMLAATLLTLIQALPGSAAQRPPAPAAAPDRCRAPR